MSTSPITDTTPKPSTPSSSTTAKAATRIIHLPTPTAYDQWAPIYDHDGNVLQQLDDIYINTIAFPQLQQLLLTTHANTPTPSTINILDLGCGTGRNTQKLLSSNLFPNISITGIDASSGMLNIARERLPEHIPLLQHDILTNPTPPEQIAGKSQVVINTLVLEHLPLSDFFSFVSACLPQQEEGYLILTNMHPEMGALSQAGFNMEQEGGEKVKVRAEAMYNHTVSELVKEAWRIARLEVVGQVVEMGVEERDVLRLGERSSKWIGKKLLVGAVFRRG